MAEYMSGILNEFDGVKADETACHGFIKIVTKGTKKVSKRP